MFKLNVRKFSSFK